MMPGDLLEWVTTDYVDQGGLAADVHRAMEHIAKAALEEEARARRVSIGTIFYSEEPVHGVAGAITYRAWSFVEGAGFGGSYE